ncbi:hypothetical protein E7T09_04940 [Deinococcus sp. KSM4-11]|nr:hypothetical protein E7T09_04940 [Deinococcus sp. KSM4-11]
MINVLAISALATAATAGAQSVELGLTGGYAGGLSGELFIHSPNLIGPVGVKFGVAYARAADAINDSAPYDPSGALYPSTFTFGNAKKSTASGGLDATESGSHTIVGLDATYGLGELAPGIDTTLYVGGRYGMFRSTEGVSGGTTTYSSNEFGIGAGAMVSYALTGNLSLVGDLGADYFFKGPINISGTRADGTSTTPDSIGTGDANYATFNNRVVRPGVEFKVRVGIKYVF